MEFSEEQISPLKSFLLTYLMPEKCYELFFQRWIFTHVPCWKIVVSKLVGFWIMAALLAPGLQVLKVYSVGGSAGLVLVSVMLEMLTVVVQIGFCVQLGFPIGAWAECVFVLVQLLLLMFLIQHYRGNTITGGVSLVVCAGVIYLLTSPLTPRVVVRTTHEWAGLIIFTSRLIQVCSNHSRGSTGHISGASVFLQLIGSLGQLFSSIQDSGLSAGSQVCGLSCCCSAVLLLQVMLFQDRQVKDGGMEREKEKKKEE